MKQLSRTPFTEVVTTFLPGDAIDECVVRGRTELEKSTDAGFLYLAPMDVAFKGDRFTFCIAHRDVDGTGKVVIDQLAGWQGTRRDPVRLRNILPLIQKKCQEYGLYTIHADQYGAAPIGEALTEFGLQLREVPFTQQSKADIFGTLRTLILDRRIELLDHPDLLKELRQLELELMPGGNLRVGHGGRHGAHDDYADAVALAAKELCAMRSVRVTLL